MFKARFTTVLAIILSLGACDPNTQSTSPDAQATDADQSTDTNAEADETVSILRTDIVPPDPPEPVIQPFEMTVGFPDGGRELDETAQAALREVLASEALEEGGPILLGGHSDAGGTDTANLRASRARAEAVRDWLIENGVSKERISLVAFGEQNPAEPNALPDGQPNEAGRAANRRVEVLVRLPQGEATETQAQESSA